MQKQHFQQIFWSLFLILMLSLNTGCGGAGEDEGRGGDASGPPAPQSTYAVTGTASGLIGTGLIIQNNETDDLAIENNGYFRFTSQMNKGTDCNVTILSQPEDPGQVCYVVNGNQTVNENDITDVQIICTYGFREVFDSEINPVNWNSTAEYSRPLVDGALEYKLTTTSDFALNYLSFNDTTCNTVSADIAITQTDLSGIGDATFTSRLESCGYHSATPGEAVGKKTGDIFAAVDITGTEPPFQAFYQVFRCLDEECGNAESVEFLTPGPNGYVQFGTDIQLGDVTTVLIDWDRLSPGLFSFQLDDGPVETFDPVAAGAEITSPEPNSAKKYLGVKTMLSNPDDIADMTTVFDNVVLDGTILDDFNSSTYLDGLIWNSTYGTIAVENARLVMEAAKEHVADVTVDTRLHSTNLRSRNNLIPNSEIAEAFITMSPETFVIDDDGDPSEVYAVIEMVFRPPGTDENDFKDNFFIQAGLKQEPSGITAQILAIGCADSSCTAKLIDQVQEFPVSVFSDTAYQFIMEHAGNGVIAISLDNSESLTLDLSELTQFAITDFSHVRLRTLARGTDMPGEEAFVRAYFDDIRFGSTD
ncbi:MAG: hypothetical protein GY874_02595 [Desulfobacteraceae bacterium]|nr:hypothetical protein [Desulfobacteraceae bacterium]